LAENSRQSAVKRSFLARIFTSFWLFKEKAPIANRHQQVLLKRMKMLLNDDC
jgi:hypothetical protein